MSIKSSRWLQVPPVLYCFSSTCLLSRGEKQGVGEGENSEVQEERCAAQSQKILREEQPC